VKYRMIRIHLLISLLIFSGTALAQRNPSPCENVDDIRFVNDWGHCQWYFWCNRNVTFYTGPCDSYNFNEEGGSDETGACDQTYECYMTDPPCPKDDVRLAVALGYDDPDCQRYTYCSNGERESVILNCTTGLRFNRITGMCDLASNVVCPGRFMPDPSNPCLNGTEALDGDINSPKSCAAFFFCKEGILIEEVECPGNLHFNPQTHVCDLPENLNPRCTEPTRDEVMQFPNQVRIPMAPYVEYLPLGHKRNMLTTTNLRPMRFSMPNYT